MALKDRHENVSRRCGEFADADGHVRGAAVMDLDECVGRAARSPQAKLADDQRREIGTPQPMRRILLFFNDGIEHDHHFIEEGTDLICAEVTSKREK